MDSARLILEYDAVLDWLAEEAHSVSGRRAALALTPDLTPEAVLQSWSFITEGRKILAEGNSPDLSDHLDLTEIMASLKLEGVLLGVEELRAVGCEAACSRRNRTFFALWTKIAPDLTTLAAGLGAFPDLIEAIEQTIGPNGDILDSASPELARLRLEVITTRQDLIAKLTRLIHSETFRPFLQDDLITIRSKRFVVPIRASAASQRLGLVHDWSKTGATAFLEPLEIVEDNNRLNFLKRREKTEIERILHCLSAKCQVAAPELMVSGGLLTRLDLILAQARLAHVWLANPPEYRSGGGFCLKAARHPLLMRRLAQNGGCMIPLDLTLEPGQPLLIISGLNAGGKTVAMKTLGLNLLLARAGLHLPVAADSHLDFPELILVVMGDEQDLTSDLSTFSGHIRSLNRVLSEARPGLLVLLDEIGSSTDPVEGAALGLAVLETLRSSGALVLAATHYQLIKTWATLTPGVVSVAVNAAEAGSLPLYGLTYGVPGFSGGLKIARRLGLPAELVSLAESYLDVGQSRTMELLARLEEERAALAQARENVENERLVLARAETDLRRQAIQEAEDFKRRSEVQNRLINETLAVVRQEFERLKAEMRAADLAGGKVANQVRFSEERARLEKSLRLARPQIQITENSLGEVREGDRVRVGALGREALVRVVNSRRGEAWVEIGGLNIKVSLKDLFLPRAEPDLKKNRVVGVTVTPTESSGLELNLLGQTVDEALTLVARELDRAALAGRKTLYIIHGFGTGRLRQSIRHYLKRHPKVRHFERAPQNIGGDGMTIVDVE